MAIRKKSQMHKDMSTYRGAGISLSRAAHLSNNRSKTSGLKTAATLFVGLAVVGGASFAAMQAMQPTPVAVAAVPETPAPAAEPIIVTKADVLVVEQVEEVSFQAPSQITDVQASEPVATRQMPSEFVTTALETKPLTPKAAPQQIETAPQNCVQEIAALARDARITFDVNGTEFSDTDKSFLRQLGTQVADCPTARIIVEGHSDPSGLALDNIQLSWDRAEKAIGLIAEAGIETAGFRAIGYGARQPIKQSDGDYDLDGSRRIEFTVREKF